MGNVWYTMMPQNECIKTLFYQTNKLFLFVCNKRWFWIEIKRLNELVNWMKHVNNVNCLKIEWQFEWRPPLRFSEWWTCVRITHYKMQTNNINWLTLLCVNKKSVFCQANWMNMLKYLNFLLSCRKWFCQSQHKHMK